MNLYEINAAIENFAFEVDEETGEILNADALDALEMARDEKIDNTACLIKNIFADEDAINAQIEILKSEIEELSKRKKQKHNRGESLKRYLSGFLNGEKFESARCKISYHSSEAVELEAGFTAWAEKTRPDLMRYKLPEPDKKAIKAALKEGEAIEGAALIKTVSMSIK